MNAPMAGGGKAAAASAEAAPSSPSPPPRPASAAASASSSKPPLPPASARPSAQRAHPSAAAATGWPPQQQPGEAAAAEEEEERYEGKVVEQHVLGLLEPALREESLSVLCKKRVKFPELPPLLWNSFGVVTVLLEEVIAVYRNISPPTISSVQSNRLCNVLALIQCIATHPETCSLLIDANIPIYLYPFLNTTCRDKPFEYVRLTCLGVIGALVKNDKTAITTYLIKSEVVPLCIRSMEVGCELSKTVSTFIIEKIILDKIGLNYICENTDRFFSLARALHSMVLNLAEQPSQSSQSAAARLLKHIIRCYRRLSEDARGAINLISCIPPVLRDGTLNHYLLDDSATQMWLEQIVYNINMAVHNINMATSHTLSQLHGLAGWQENMR